MSTTTATTKRKAKATSAAAPSSPDFEQDRAALAADAAAMMEGAQACHSMLLEIATAGFATFAPDPETKGADDDGFRSNYPVADQAVSTTLDTYSGNDGFRRALSTYLLRAAEQDPPKLDQQTAQDLLTDQGFRCAVDRAHGIKVSVPPIDDRQLTQRQYRTVLEVIATRSHTLNTLLMQLQQRGGVTDWADAAVLDAAQQLTEVLGGMADDALGGEVHGDMRNWLYGPNFAQPR